MNKLDAQTAKKLLEKGFPVYAEFPLRTYTGKIQVRGRVESIGTKFVTIVTTLTDNKVLLNEVSRFDNG